MLAIICNKLYNLIYQLMLLFATCYITINNATLTYQIFEV